MAIANTRMMGLTTLEDVQLAQVDALLNAWTEELAKSWQAVLEEGKRLDEESKRHAIEAAQRHTQEILDLALDHSVEQYLQSLRAIAQDKGFHVSVPEGARAASTSIQGPAFAIESLIADIQFEDRDGLGDDDPKRAQRSAAWAMGEGLMPHPGDLASLLQLSPLDTEWTRRFQDVATALDKIDAKPAPNAQLKAFTASERLDALKEYSELLAGYSSERLVAAIANPNALGVRAPPPVPAARSSGKLMSQADFMSMMSAYQRRAP